MHLHNVLIKPVSGSCNMECEYCFYCDEASKRHTPNYGVMTEATLNNIMKKVLLKAGQDVCFAFQGGEPLLRGIDFYRRAMELERKYNRNHVGIWNTLQTNGLLLNEEWCEFFREHHFLIGISLDGIQKTHDACRHTSDGSPTYERIIQNIQLLEQYQIEYNLLTVVNKIVALHVREIYAEYQRNHWMHQQYIACLDPWQEEWGKQKYSLLPEEYGRFLITLFDLWFRDWRRGRSPYIRQFENYIGILMGYPPEACGQSGQCCIQGVMEADGGVYPCDFYVLDPYRLGDINTDQIADFFDNPIAGEFLREGEKISAACKECKYYLLCRGGCKRYWIRDEKGYRNYYCKSYQMFFDSAMTRLEDIAGYLKSQADLHQKNKK